MFLEGEVLVNWLRLVGGFVFFDEIGVGQDFVKNVFRYVYILRDCCIGLRIINENKMLINYGLYEQFVF